MLMSDVVAWLLTLPYIVIYAACGAVAGATGALVGYAGEKIFGPNKAWRFISIVFIVVSVQITSKAIIPSLQQNAWPYEAVRVLKQTRLFHVIFKYHPDAEIDTLEKFKALMAERSSGSAPSSARAIGSALAEKYVNLHVLMASDGAISALFKSELGIVNYAKSQPDACVALYLGNLTALSNSCRKI